MEIHSGRVAWSMRGFLILLLSLPLVPALLAALDGGGLVVVLATAAALAMLIAATALVRRGVRVQRREAMSRYTRADTHLLTWLGCAAVGLACFTLQYFVAARSPWYAAAVGAVGAAAAFLSYGSMWARARPRAADGYTSEEVVAALRAAEAQVETIRGVYLRLPRGDVRRKLRRLASKTQAFLQSVETDPRELRRARKFLNVFLPGVAEVAQTYRQSLEHGPDPDFDQRLGNLLDKTSRALDRHDAQRAGKVAFNLDVQMAVLRTQLDEELRR